MDVIHEVVRWAEEHLGFFCDDSAHAEMRRKLTSAAREKGFEDGATFARHFFQELSSEERIRVLAPLLTVGETYFFREHEALQAFVDEALPEILQYRQNCNDRRIRLWSAGCSTGEEAYTVAMIMTEALRGHPAGGFSLLATDVNEKALETARDGRYRPWSIRNPVPARYASHFIQDGGGTIRVREELKDRIRFEALNLMAGGYPSPLNGTWDLDVIFCRNVLMYFHSRGRREVLSRFYRSLREGGWLLLSPSEIHVADPTFWETVRTPQAILLRKRSPNVQSEEMSRNGLVWGRMDPAAMMSTPAESGREGHRAPVLATLPGPRSTPRLFKGPAFHDLRAPSASRPFEGSLGCQPERGVACFGKASSVSMPGRSLPHALAEDAAAEFSRLVSLGLLEEAGHFAERLLREPQENIQGFRDTLLSLIQALVSRSEAEKALRLIDAALTVHKFDPALYHLKGAIHADRGDLGVAAAAYRQMLYVAPESPLAMFSLAMICRREGQNDAARRYLDGAKKALQSQQEKDELPFSEGLSVGHLRRMIEKCLETLDANGREETL